MFGNVKKNIWPFSCQLSSRLHAAQIERLWRVLKASPRGPDFQGYIPLGLLEQELKTQKGLQPAHTHTHARPSQIEVTWLGRQFLKWKPIAQMTEFLLLLHSRISSMEVWNAIVSQSAMFLEVQREIMRHSCSVLTLQTVQSGRRISPGSGRALSWKFNDNGFQL